MTNNQKNHVQSKDSILLKISICVIALCGITIIYSFFKLYSGWLDYQHAKELKTIQDITQPFSNALKDFMFERGRMNVVLSADGPISQENLSFIDERRKASDEYFEAGFSIMEENYPKEAGLLRQEYNKIEALRNKMDTEAQKTIGQRYPDNRKQWFKSCTDYINLVSLTIKEINGRNVDNRLIYFYNKLIFDTLRYRSIVGNESSIFTAAITGSKTISDDEYAELLTLRGESRQVWSDTKYIVEMIGSDDLIKAAETVQNKYFEQFRPNQDRLLDLVLRGQLYEGADKEIAKLSVPALDSILLLADTAMKEIDVENQKNLKEGLQSLATGLLQMLLSIVFLIFAPAYLQKKFINPLHRIVELIENLSEGSTDAEVPYVQRKDEIGLLSNGVLMLKKSIEEEQVLKRELNDAIIKLEDLSIKDPLTGLYNRRYIIERIAELETRYRRNKSIFSVIICDIDFFKSFNDGYGHACGDMVLTQVKSLIYSCCREQDITARWGGEEFLILTPDTSHSGARNLAERIRKKLEDSTLQYEDNSLKLTMTFGVSEYSESLGIEGTIHNADMALLKGKESGRNRVVVASV